MLRHYSEDNEEFVLGIFSVDRDFEDLIDSVQNITGFTFDKTKSNLFRDCGEFSSDTVIISKGVIDTMEDWFDLLEDNINVYIVI